MYVLHFLQTEGFLECVQIFRIARSLWVIACNLITGRDYLWPRKRRCEARENLLRSRQNYLNKMWEPITAARNSETNVVRAEPEIYGSRERSKSCIGFEPKLWDMQDSVFHAARDADIDIRLLEIYYREGPATPPRIRFLGEIKAGDLRLNYYLVTGSLYPHWHN